MADEEVQFRKRVADEYSQARAQQGELKEGGELLADQMAILMNIYERNASRAIKEGNELALRLARQGYTTFRQLASGINATSPLLAEALTRHPEHVIVPDRVRVPVVRLIVVDVAE